MTQPETTVTNEAADAQHRAPLDMSAGEFRALGHDLVERIAAFLEEMPHRPAAPDISPQEARARLGQGELPEAGADSEALLARAAGLAMNGCRINGHPRSWGYVIGSPAPIGILGDFLASAVNPNLASWSSAQVPTEIEGQAVRWIAELLGYPGDCGGLLTSGGNMANFIGLLAARRAHADWDLRRQGLTPGGGRLRIYASRETHTWLEKGADIFGLGTDAVRFIGTDSKQRMDTGELRARIVADKKAGERPFMLVGAAGTVSTGAIDPLPELAAIAREHGLWFHVDGCYGAPAIVDPDAPEDLRGLRAADSLAVDAHKWLYVPLEAGCALVRDRKGLRETFSFHPPYYHFTAGDDEVSHYHEYGPQNSRGFRALKVWLALQRAGRAGYRRMIADNLHLARAMAEALSGTAEIELGSQSLSITTFRYVPRDLDTTRDADRLSALNREILTRVQKGGEAFLSNAVIEG
jgi:glutamate/tyrosine decarboxylase-like PLP-dependent enzyme